MINGGIKDNVLPSRAMAVVNFRILPGSSIEDVMVHVPNVVDDSRVKIGRYGYDFNEPSNGANIHCPGVGGRRNRLQILWKVDR